MHPSQGEPVRRPVRSTTADIYRKLAGLTVTSSPLGATPLKDVIRDDVSAWREALPAGPLTQNGKAYELLVSVFGDAAREGKIAVSPATLRGAGPGKAPDVVAAGSAITSGEDGAGQDSAHAPSTLLYEEPLSAE